MNHTTTSGLTTPMGPWQTGALCRGYDDLFFPDGETGTASLAQIEAAKDVCHACPVMTQCQGWALANREEHGVWGGMSAAERRSFHRRATRTTRTRTSSALFSYDTFRDAYDALAMAVDGHIEWTGGDQVRINGTRTSPNQVAWRATHDTPPVGQVLVDCDHEGCVQHLTDQAARHARREGDRWTRHTSATEQVA